MHRFCNFLLAIYITRHIWETLAVCIFSSPCICQRQNWGWCLIVGISRYRMDRKLIRFIRIYKVICSSEHVFRVHMETLLCCQSTGHRPSS